jgi:hypothetical protein
MACHVGDSVSSGLALVAGALIDDIAAIVAQLPVCGATLLQGMTREDALAVMKDIFENGDVSGVPEQTLGPLPVVSIDQLNAPSMLACIQAFRWFVEQGGDAALTGKIGPLGFFPRRLWHVVLS